MSDDPLVNLDAEQALLGALMANSTAIERVQDFLKPEHFSEPIHSEIFGAVVELSAEGRRADPVTVRDRITLDALEPIGGAGYLSHLLASATSVINAPDYGKAVFEAAIRRSIREVADDIAKVAERPPKGMSLGDQFDDAEQRFADLRDQARIRGIKSMSEYLDDSVNLAAAAYKNERPAGYDWFIPDAEYVVDTRMEPGDLQGLLGASGDAKTSTAVQQARFSAEQGVPVLLLSGEQSVIQCIRQMHAQRLSLTARNIKNGHYTESDYARIVADAQALKALPLRIETWSDMKVGQLTSIVRAFNRRYGPGIVIIDHAKKIVPNNPRDILAQQVFQVYESLKALAMQSGNAILLLMQRSSEFLKRRVMRPIRGDCYGGEGTLQNLDACLAIYQPGKWIRERAKVEESNERRDKMIAKAEQVDDAAGIDATTLELHCLKTRFGEEGRQANVRFVGKFTRIETLQPAEAPDLNID